MRATATHPGIPSCQRSFFCIVPLKVFCILRIVTAIDFFISRWATSGAILPRQNLHKQIELKITRSYDLRFATGQIVGR